MSDKKDRKEKDKIIKKIEIEKHNTKDDCWLVMDKKVYDLSGWKHPGSFEPLKEYAGGQKDAWQAFLDTDHTKKAVNIMNEKFIGIIDESEFVNDNLDGDEPSLLEKIQSTDPKVLIGKIVLVAFYLTFFFWLLNDQLK